VARGLARAAALVAHNAAFLNFVLPSERVRPTPSEAAELRRRLLALFEADWRNIHDGVYPASLTRDFSWRRLLAVYPRIVRDAPRVRLRALRNDFDDLPPGTEQFPRYYRRNFHFQTAGWFSRESAAMYDAQVEFLFNGTASAMRRQILPPLVKALRSRAPGSLKMMDLATGTGPVLRLLSATFRGAQLYGCDLSPQYIAHTRAELTDIVPLSLVVENAESLPFVEGHFDAMTCVYLMHELPPSARNNVLREAARVIAPGGTFVLADSVQLADAPLLRRQLEDFPKRFHEPFYGQYLRDDLDARFDAAGFDVVEVSQHMVTKVWTARRRVH
jgi:ubiquinone/menaquinone biosynthesis C-methylase UbiE